MMLASSRASTRKMGKRMEQEILKRGISSFESLVSISSKHLSLSLSFLLDIIFMSSVYYTRFLPAMITGFTFDLYSHLDTLYLSLSLTRMLLVCNFQERRVYSGGNLMIALVTIKQLDREYFCC